MTNKKDLSQTAKDVPTVEVILKIVPNADILAKAYESEILAKRARVALAEIMEAGKRGAPSTRHPICQRRSGAI